ncbi:hypothetical protein [Phenylobacterium zucineum]|uniref:hypothetical protein n=1 Tax=Phenylobacterium zucineum TaxID=284016 RepID=UPI00030B2870|nr:hypothetical protein [Phenylobacterium zucineum]
MRKVLILTAVAAAASGLAACQEGGQGRSRAAAGDADGLCKPFAAPGQAAAPGGLDQGGAAVDDCLHRWGYTLARSTDEAGAVAQAALAACSAPLARWNQQTLSQAAGGGPPMEAPSLLTGEPTNPIAEHNSFAEGRALFYVVQARAGKCDPPRETAPAQTPAAGAANSPDR